MFAGLVAGVCDADACTLRGPGFGAPVFNISMIRVFNISALLLIKKRKMASSASGCRCSRG